MIRSLIATNGNSLDDTSIKLRRNIARQSLEIAFSKDQPLWLDVVEPTRDELEWLESLLKLHPLVMQDVGRRDHRPTLSVYPNYLFITLFEPQLQQRQIIAQEIHCLVGDTFFVTVRSGQDLEVNQVYNRVAQQNPEAWRRGVPYLLYLTIQHVVDAYYPLLDRLSLWLDSLEQSVLMGESPPPTIRRDIYHVKQQLITLRQMVAPQREVLSSAIGTDRLAETNENRDLFRHLYERLLRVYDVVDAQRDLSSNILDLIQSHETTKLTNAVSRLTILSMIFFPLTLIAALLELNFITPENPSTLPISGATALVGLVIIMSGIGGMLFWFFHQKGWI